MKQLFRFFTMLLLAAVTSTQAWAGDWVIPAPAGQAIEPEVEYYIFNVGTNQFLDKGNAWGTQATMTTKGMKFILKKDVGAGIEDQVY